MNTEQQVYEALCRAADAGERCPTNFALTEIVGADSVATASRAVICLRDKGLIEIERVSSSRIVTITATGKSTAREKPRKKRQPPKRKNRRAEARPDDLFLTQRKLEAERERRRRVEACLAAEKPGLNGKRGSQRPVWEMPA